MGHYSSIDHSSLQVYSPSNLLNNKETSNPLKDFSRQLKNLHHHLLRLPPSWNSQLKV